MRDKHISATPTTGRQRGSETIDFTGRQRFSDSMVTKDKSPFRDTWQKTFQKSAFRTFLFLLLAFVLLPAQVNALNQIRNGTFDANFTTGTNPVGWYMSPPVVTEGTMKVISANEGYPNPRSIQVEYVKNNTGSNNFFYPAQIYLQQTFLVPRSTAVNARFTSAHRETAPDNTEWKMTHEGSIRKTSDEETIVEKFYYQYHQTFASLHNWPSVLTDKEISLEANTGYVARLFFNLECWKGNTLNIYVDTITCNVSPSGLVATETQVAVPTTSRGECLLTWDTSTGTAILHPTTPYQLYKGPGENGPWTPFATPTTTTHTDSPTEDVVYYAVSDIDSTGEESPLSIFASYRTAKLEVIKVENTTENVTKGQDGLPVRVYVKNTGHTAATLNTVELQFDSPVNGIYTIGAPSPSLPITLSGGETRTITFLLSIAADSDSGLDFIDAKLTGINTQTIAAISDNASDVKAKWLIQAPPKLTLVNIVAPSVVYLDQTGVNIELVVRNDGEAAAKWDLWNGTEMNFSLGEYLNLRPSDVPFPYNSIIYNGQTSIISYEIDVSPYSTTGISTINASMSYLDYNTAKPFRNDEGDPTPPSWNVQAGILETYRGPAQFPAWTIKSSSFNQGNFIVYTKGMNLQPDRDFRMRWYDASGTQVLAEMTATDMNGELYGSYQLNGSSPLGKWRVIVSRVNNQIPLCETYFDVVVPASLTVEMLVPSFLTRNQPFDVITRLVNAGGSRIDTGYASPLTLAVGNSGTATFISGPSHDFVTVAPYSFTDITWAHEASTIGSFAVKGSGYGVDSNDLRNLVGATSTSNLCIIQDPPVLTITSIDTTETTVYRNQQDLIVTMTINNTGSASAIITSANLNFSNGTHYQSLESHPASFTLPADTPTVLSFRVSVDANSNTGLSVITGSIVGLDANWPTSVPLATSSVTPISDSWTINAIAGFCGTTSDFSPEQYRFNAGQIVWTKFINIPALKNTGYRVSFLVAGDTADTTTPNEGSLVPVDGELLSNYMLPDTAVGEWKTTLHTVSGKNPVNPPIGVQYFTVNRQGSINASTKFVPDDIEINSEVSLEMSISNPVVYGSTIKDITPSSPLKLGGSTGELLYLSGPEPASASLVAGSMATFTWTYRAIQHSGLSGEYRMIASATGNDGNLTYGDAGYSTSTTSISEALKIRFRDLTYASASIDFGAMLCGETRVIGSSRVNNVGSTDLTRTSWSKTVYENSLSSDTVHPNNLTLYPEDGFLVPAAAPSFTSTYAELTIPYNQPAGYYVATITVFEDMLPYNEVRDAAEPFYVFSSTVTASACRVVYTNPSYLDLGDWEDNVNVATRSITIHNGGNLNLTELKFKQENITPFTFSMTPASPGSLATNAICIASITAYIPTGMADGVYIATYTVWDDSVNTNDLVDAGEASASFQIRVGIGNQKMHFTLNPTDFGNGTPTYPLPDQSFEITNTGKRTLDKLRYLSANLYHVDLPGIYIPSDEIELVLPPSIDVNATETAYAYMFIPAGSAIGTYTGDVIIFEDENSDGTYVGGDNEAPTPLTLKVYVNPYRGIRVLKPVVDAGPLTRLENGIATFSVKNTGNVVLGHLRWDKVDLNSDSNTLLQANYDFNSQPTQPFNTIFPATMSMTIPIDQPDGEYFGQYSWLYDDLESDGRLPGFDPQSPFSVSAQVGTKYIDIIDSNLLIENAMPSFLSDSANFTIKNTGTLMLTRPMATASALVGPMTIPATASIFVPNVFEYMVKNKTHTGIWRVNVPPGTLEGVYTGTITVWNDTNFNNRIDDPAEASDTASLELRVIAKTVIGVSPAILEFGYVEPERSASVNFIIVNLGNQDILGIPIRAVSGDLPPEASGPNTIDASNLVFSPDPFTMNLPIGGSAPAVATITIPAGQSSVTYLGTQRIYVDSDLPGGSYTAGEVTATFTAKVSVGTKKINVADVNMDSHAHATTATTNFTLNNTGNVNANRIRWIPQGISDGTTTLTPILGPNSSITAGGTLNCSVSVVIPQYTPPGVYTGIQTVYDDDLAPLGSLDPSREASDTFMLTLTVEASPDLVIDLVDPIFPVNLSLGQQTSVDVTYRNAGNVPLTDLTWGSPMALMTGSDGGNMTPTFDPLPLPTIDPGAPAQTCSLIFTADAAQATGTYTATQNLRSTVYPAASVNLPVEVLVVAQTGPKNLEAGTVFQSIATETFIAKDDFIFSVYVGFEDGVPASATIGFRQDKIDDMPAEPMDYITIDQNGNLDPAGVGGIAGRIRTGNKTWYRLYLNFNGTLDPLTESTYLILSNSSSITGTDLWFDGVQLEKANGRDRPTAYGEGMKLYSPNNRTDLEGKARYSEW